MSDTHATYKIIGVAPGRIVETIRQGAPAESWLCEFGRRRRCEMVIRYFPSRKGWRILDLRPATSVSPANRKYTMWRGQVRSAYYPTEDAAVMVAMTKLGCAPSTG